MIRLIKKTSNKTLFWQTWKGKKQLHIQSGTLGIEGKEENRPLKWFESAKKVMNNLAIEKTVQGYEYVRVDTFIKIAIQYRYEDESQFEMAEEKSLFVEDLVDDILHSTGNGELYGSEIGDGAGITFCLVINKDIALDTIVSELSKHRVLDGAEIAFLNEENTYIFLYPEGADFKLV